MNVLTAAVSTLCGALGFAVVAGFGLWATPWPEDFAVTLKMEHLAEHGDRYDALIVGSSNIYRSYDPAVIDAELAERGVPLRTFNLGGASMFSFETDYVLRRALALEKVRPEYVLIEPGDWDAEPKTPESLSNMLSNRSVFWHDPRQTWNVLRSIAKGDTSPWHKQYLARHHLHAFCYKVTSYGQGRRIWGSFTDASEDQPVTPEHVASGRGYQALEEMTGPVMQARRRLLTNDLPGYKRKILEMAEANAAPLPADANCRRELERQMAFIRSAGAEPVYVVPPAGIQAHHALRLGEEGAIPLIAFNDPNLYPTFYAPQARFDPNHLNRAATALFSKDFAAELARFLTR